MEAMEVTERDALTVTGLRKTFEADNAPVRALRGVDLAVEAGEFIAVMGPSGCGKSTLLNLVAGLDVPDEGTITVAGETVTGRTEDDLARMRRKHMGIVFQFFNLLEGMTVLENVVLPSVIAGRKRKMAETRARDLLDLLGISDKASAAPGVLSGGQRQRLAVARAPPTEPALRRAPEPTGPSPGRFIVAGLLVPAAAIVGAAGALWGGEPGGITGVAAVTAGLVITWALVAMATARSRERTPQWQLAAGALIAAVAAAAGR